MASPEPRAVFGSFGYGNLGDELVADCLGAVLESVGQPSDLAVLTRFKGALNLPGIHDLSAAGDWMRDNPGARVILAGGGIVMPQKKSCLNRAFSVKAADTRFTAFAISVEPGVRYGVRDRFTLGRQLAQLGPVAVRDEMSADVLVRLFPDHPVRVVGDIGLWTRATAVPDVIAAMAAEPGICVTLHTTWAPGEILPWIVPELVTLARTHRLPLTVLPFSPFGEPDIDIHRRLVAALRHTAPDLTVQAPAEVLPPEELDHGVAAALMKAARLVVATRLHGCVVACAQRTPFVALAYHPKLVGFAQAVNRPSALLPAAPPVRQAKDVYGYRFADLGLRVGDLVARSETAMADRDFSAVDFYRRRQQVALAEMLGASVPA
jgi:hypothetical protein